MRASIPSVKHWALARGCCAPLRTPCLSRRSRSSRRTGAPPPDPRTDARTAQRRTVVVAARVPRAGQAPCGERQALRLPDALAPGHEVVSGLGERWLDACVGSEDHAAAGDVAGRLLHPPCRRVRSLPAGITRAAGAGWERPRTRQKGRQKPPVAGPSIRRMDGGRSQPHSPPKSGDSGSRACDRIQRHQRILRAIRMRSSANKYANKGGSDLFPYEGGPDHDPGEGKSLPGVGPVSRVPQVCRKARRCTTGGAPFPGRMTRGDRRGWPARPLHGVDRPDGGAPGRRSKVRYVPAVAPPGAAGGPRPRQPVGSKAPKLPAATPFGPGFPAK